MIGFARAGRAAAALLALAACAAGRTRPPAAAEAAPLEATRAFYRALHAGDASGAARLVDGPRAGEATAAFVQLARAYEALEQAIAARFGREAARAVGYAERVAAEEDALRSARAEVQGDRATVLSEERPLATLRRVDGAWKVVLEEALADEHGLAALAGEAEASAVAAEKVGPAVRGGLFDSAADALETFRNEADIARGGLVPDGEGPGEPASPDAEQPGEPLEGGPEL
ncbi:hypothetical protein [Anaeromyxobacter diazotrophicus]|uniref:DUF4142 domain-containing protein n=1 Tax=Anaeromyxobacter diazotrophicus TaxID=2590199 RepID=A0A7I9VIS0_9BACT|nr:hypothetical protein [Anaeromyxobacter diazotrophicus]GEJ56265.1 hypothetical protein AMYX_10060 [Anaeromyxobacter diazotrophicus]